MAKQSRAGKRAVEPPGRIAELRSPRATSDAARAARTGAPADRASHWFNGERPSKPIGLRPQTRERIVKRTMTVVIALGLIVPAVAAASQSATGRTRRAIERVLFPGGPPAAPQRCLLIEVTTKDGGNWATFAADSSARACAHWVANGEALLHRSRGRWREAAGGDYPFPCAKLRVPAAVRQDLHLSCGNGGP